MSLFGKVETPRAERPGPPVKPLTELSLRVYGARLEPEQNVVRLHAEAKTAFADGTTGAGVSVGFFLNGRTLTDIVSDEYGLALLDDDVPVDRFHVGENELVLRVKGFAREVSQSLAVEKTKPVLPTPPERAVPEFAFQTLTAESNNGPTVNAEARRLMEQEFDYEQAVEVLELLPPVFRDVKLYANAVTLRDRVRDLDEQLAEVRRDGTPEELYHVATLLSEILPNHDGLLRLIATLPKPLPKTLMNSIGMELVLILPGRFEMGAADNETNASPDEKRTHRVRISRAFYMGVFPVTQAEYQKVMGTNPSNFSSVFGQDNSRFPVEHVSWHDAQQFCRKLTELCEKNNTERYRLPTEAEWEYACRAGTKTAYTFGDSLSVADANFGKSVDRPSTVGLYRPNAFGLYDMHGNVAEWCEDVYDEDAYDLRRGKITTDPLVTSGSEYRVLRGGSWSNDSRNTRSAFRNRSTPDSRHGYDGFRVVCWSSP